MKWHQDRGDVIWYGVTYTVDVYIVLMDVLEPGNRRTDRQRNEMKDRYDVTISEQGLLRALL